jgi:hypothetical protein
MGIRVVSEERLTPYPHGPNSAWKRIFWSVSLDREAPWAASPTRYGVWRT